jgi:hypothetical protein
MVWLVLASLGAVLWLAGPATQSERIRNICRPTTCAVYQLDASATNTLGGHGISLTAYAILTVAILGALSVIWYGLAGLIMWRRPTDRGAVAAAFFLVLFPLLEVAAWIPSAPRVVQTLLPAIGIAVLFIFCLLFPDGNFAPRWTIWLVPVCLLGGLSTFFPNALHAVVFLIVLASIVGAQVSRYRSISSWTERQQTKWALFGLVTAIVGFAALALGFVLLPASQSGHGSLFLSFAASTGLALVSSAIPITIGVAVLRYHLWDINRVISVALVYTSLTVILGGIYIAGVIGLQALLQVFAGNTSQVAIALSTLAIAALFGPLRRRIQTEIDRRFYRRKYDAVRTLAAYGDHLRAETDLEQFRRDLTSVVAETFQPEHVSLWLRK